MATWYEQGSAMQSFGKVKRYCADTAEVQRMEELRTQLSNTQRALEKSYLMLRAAEESLDIAAIDEAEWGWQLEED